MIEAEKYTLEEVDQQKSLVMKRMKKDFDYLTTGVLKENQKHLLASLHFRAIYDRLLFVPSIGITLVSGILAVLAQSGLYSDAINTRCTLSVAVLAAFSVFWQSLMKQLDFGGRASLHDSAAMALSRIYKVALMKSREQRIEELDSALAGRAIDREQVTRDVSADLGKVEEGSPSMMEEDPNNGDSTFEERGTVSNAGSMKAIKSVPDGDDHLTLSKQFQQATQSCTSVIPIKISTAFNALESRIYVCNKKLVPCGNVNQPKIAWERVYPALYHQLTLTIIGSKWWPYRVPDANWAVTKTIEDFDAHDAFLLEVLVKRANTIENEYNSLAIDTTPLLSGLP
ncbi:hypothetical protein ACHAWF_014347 [Thalassiosira exigua]